MLLILAIILNFDAAKNFASKSRILLEHWYIKLRKLPLNEIYAMHPNMLSGFELFCFAILHFGMVLLLMFTEEPLERLKRIL